VSNLQAFDGSGLQAFLASGLQVRGGGGYCALPFDTYAIRIEYDVSGTPISGTSIYSSLLSPLDCYAKQEACSGGYYKSEEQRIYCFAKKGLPNHYVWSKFPEGDNSKWRMDWDLAASPVGADGISGAIDIYALTSKYDESYAWDNLPGGSINACNTQQRGISSYVTAANCVSNGITGVGFTMGDVKGLFAFYAFLQWFLPTQDWWGYEIRPVISHMDEDVFDSLTYKFGSYRARGEIDPKTWKFGTEGWYLQSSGGLVT